MKIDEIRADARKREFRIIAGGDTFAFPFAKLRLAPSSADRVVEAFPDPDLGDEGFTYRLESGQEDTVHFDAVREANLEPEYLQEVLLHRLSVEAKKGLEMSGLGKRQVARQLGTSPSQLYRLLDPANRAKSLGQLLFLLRLVDREVQVTVSRRRARRRSAEAFQLFCDRSGYYRFRLKQADGRVALQSAQFASKQSCRRAIRRVMDYTTHISHYERVHSGGGSYWFRIVADDHQVIARSPAFRTAARRDSALSYVVQHAHELGVEEVPA
jgi:uncharacterized protein YegP (UPF0339 family)